MSIFECSLYGFFDVKKHWEMVDRAKQALGKYLFKKLLEWIPGYGALEEAKLRFL